MNEMAHQDPFEPAVRVFVSYAREDKRWLDPAYAYNLIPFLAESMRRHNVVFWYDTELKPGDVFKRQIESEIDLAQIAVLIVSQSFLNSEFIEQIEMPRIAEPARTGQTIVIPVLVEPCDWGDYPFLADRQMVPRANPLIDFTESEAKWAKVKFQILDGLKAQLKRIKEASQHQAMAAGGAARNTGEKIGSGAALSDARVSSAGPLADQEPRKRVARELWKRIPVWGWGIVALALAAMLFVLLKGNLGSHEATTSARSGTSVRLTSIFGTGDARKLSAVGDGGVVIESDDGGVTWEPRSIGIPNHLESIFGTSDGKRLWAVGAGGTIIESEDGGITWKQRKSNTSDALLANFGTSDGKKQWAVSSLGNIVESQDGGANWTVQGTGASWLGSIAGTGDGRHLWAVGGNGTILESDDGGAKWVTRYSSVQTTLSAIFASADGSRLWAVGAGTVAESDDGGSTWTTHSTGNATWPHAIFGTSDGTRLWAVGDSGMIIESDDKGMTWTQRKSGTTNPLCAILGTSDGKNLSIVGDNGIVLTSNNGGKTWTK